MKKLLWIAIAGIVLCTLPAISHHAAEGIVDEEIYAMIDELVADTPHGEMTLEDLGSGTTQMTITTRTVKALETMIDDGVLTYASMLDGQVTVEIAFGGKDGVTMTVTQVE